MAIRNIVKEGDPILRKTSRPVQKFDEKLWQILDDMRETMAQANGAGLAAVQVGLLRRAVIVDVGDGSGVLELINPEIIEADGEQEGQEGCLSLPDQWAIVKRPNHVKVRAQNRRGAWRIVEGEGLKARAICHELDHLDGRLFIDCMTRRITQEELRRMQEDRIQKGKE